MPNGNGKFAVRRTVTGLGLFTLRPIPAGRRIIEFVGKIITGEEAEIKGGKYLFEINENCYIDGSARTNLGRYLNHSCRPNAVAHISGKRVWIWSKRAIGAGEEITFSYSKTFVKEYLASQGLKCRCEKCAARPLLSIRPTSPAAAAPPPARPGRRATSPVPRG